MPELRALPSLEALEDGSLMLIFYGPPNVAVSWSFVPDVGRLSLLSNSTNDRGIAAAVFWPAPGSSGQQVVVSVSYGC